MNEVREPPYLDAELRPYRSLPPRGFLILLIFIGGVSFIAGIVFALHGAWPVLGFFGLDVLAIYIAFRLNYRSGRTVEYLRLTRDELVLRRIAPNGREDRWAFHPFWVRIDTRRGRFGEGQLALRSRDLAVAFARFLTADQRAALLAELREALRRWRDGAPPRPRAPGPHLFRPKTSIME